MLKRAPFGFVVAVVARAGTLAPAPASGRAGESWLERPPAAWNRPGMLIPAPDGGPAAPRVATEGSKRALTVSGRGSCRSRW